MDGDLQRKSVTFEGDREKEHILVEFEMEKEQEDLESLPFETSPERSPRAISPLNDIEEREGVGNMLTEAAIRTRIPTGKGREFEVQRLKDSRRNALSNLTKQMNKVRPLF